MDDIEIISGFFVVNSGVLLFIAFLIIVLVLLKIWTTLRALPTLKDLEMQRDVENARGLLLAYLQDLRFQYLVGLSGLHVLDEGAVHLALCVADEFQISSKMSGAG
ncbi:hypothetical protein BTUL_0015g00280 [Botrytis tulipae]|uniref:Uncharacterized protein n=1 Tax=Botrytis tulipae TaxID=87230 RepID=A0A4Z1F3W2_9HELO|nr:hypothetical protein BTUL_0015g00280 [Botrytis tulipae]